MKNISIQGQLILRLTFNPGLALTGFRTTRPCEVEKKLFGSLNVRDAALIIVSFPFSCTVVRTKLVKSARESVQPAFITSESRFVVSKHVSVSFSGAGMVQWRERSPLTSVARVRCHIWVEFVVVSRLAPRVYCFPGQPLQK